MRDYRLEASFTFSRYSYREAAVRLAYNSLLIRSSFIVLIGHILASKDSIFNSTSIRGLRYSRCNNVWVYKKVFTAIWLFKSYLRLIKASTWLVAPSLYIIMKLNWDRMSA